MGECVMFKVYYRVHGVQGVSADSKGTGRVGRAAPVRGQLPEEVPRPGPGNHRSPQNGAHEIPQTNDPLQNAARPYSLWCRSQRVSE